MSATYGIDGAAVTFACNEAFHRLCVTEGYLSGFGPTGVDSDEEVARATCLGDLAP